MGAIIAAFALIDSCMHNNEFEDAHLYASTLWEIINHKHNKIPEDQRQLYIVDGAYFLATTTLYSDLCIAETLDHFHDFGEEVLRLFEQAIANDARVFGSSLRT